MPPKPKPRQRARPPWRPPATPLGQFVGQHYAPRLQAGAFRRFRANKNLVPIVQEDETVKLTTPAQRRRLPNILIGEPGVRGPFTATNPALNPVDWELVANASNVRFARPRTELSGLDPQDVRDIRDFDALTARQGQRITGAYENYATQAAADRDAAAAALGNLANLAGAGYSPRTAGAPAPGGVTGPAPTGAEAMLPAILGLGQREQSMAQSAQQIAAMSTLPTVARSEGLAATERFTGERQGQRKDFLSKLREIQATQETASAEQAAEHERWRRELAATLRGQNLGFLGTQIGQQTDLTQAMLGHQASAAEQQAGFGHDISMAGVEAQQEAVGQQFRTPKQLRTGGFTLGPWSTKPKGLKGVNLEQSTTGIWFGKPKTGAKGAGVDPEKRTQAIASMQSDVGARIDVGKDPSKEVSRDNPKVGSRGLSAYEVAQANAEAFDVPLAWAYAQARKMGFHHREGEWRPPAWQGAAPNARVARPLPRPGSLLGGL